MNKTTSGLLGLGLVIVVALGINFFSGKSKSPAVAQETGVPQGGLKLPIKEQKASPKSSNGKAEPLDFLTGSGQDVEEKTVQFVGGRKIFDRDGNGQPTSRIKLIVLTDNYGVQYPIYNQAQEENGAEFGLPEGFKLKQEYKIKGTKLRPYRGKQQFQIREWVKE